MRSLAREAYTISTPNRFRSFCLEDQIKHVEKDYLETKECIIHEGKVFEFYAIRKQTGYSAKHVSSIIDGIRDQGREVLIIDLPRNIRKIFASVVV